MSPVSKTTTTSPTQLVERKFAKTLLDYYNAEKNPECPLQSIYYALLYWVYEMKGQYEETDGDELEDENEDEDEEDLFDPKYRYN